MSMLPQAPQTLFTQKRRTCPRQFNELKADRSALFGTVGMAGTDLHVATAAAPSRTVHGLGPKWQQKHSNHEWSSVPGAGSGAAVNECQTRYLSLVLPCSVHGPVHLCTAGNHLARPLLSGQEAGPSQDGLSSSGPQTPWRSVYPCRLWQLPGAAAGAREAKLPAMTVASAHPSVLTSRCFSSFRIWQLPGAAAIPGAGGGAAVHERGGRHQAHARRVAGEHCVCSVCSVESHMPGECRCHGSVRCQKTLSKRTDLPHGALQVNAHRAQLDCHLLSAPGGNIYVCCGGVCAG